jgi:hypothetical protein
MRRSEERDLSSPYVCSSCLDYDLTVHNLPFLDPTIIVAPPPKILLLSVTWKDFQFSKGLSLRSFYESIPSTLSTLLETVISH